MNRPIEFRLYDEKTGVHSDPFDPFNMLGVVYWPDSREPTPINFCNHYIKEQYTGLTDKNGNKSFGGDNIKDSRGITYVIKWYDDLACWMAESLHADEYLSSVGEFEVIGTIHDAKTEARG